MGAIELTICMGSSCFTRGNNETLRSIQEYLKKNKLEDAVKFKGELCSCNCKKGPNLKIGEKSFHGIDAVSAITILNENLVNKQEG